MSYFPCSHWSDCVPPAEGVAVRNFSAEGPDVPSFFGLYQCRLELGTNPPFDTCTSIVSQQQADWCAARCLARGIFVNELQTFTACGNKFTVAAGTILANSVAEANAQALKFATASANALCLFGNAESTCSAVCPNSAISSYTVPANSFRGPSQAILNQQAAALACETANLLCFGALVSNTEQSCSIVCQGTNGTATVVIPAGTVLGFTIESANARALELACALALIACDSLPPLVPSTVQTCSQLCNGVTITQVVPAGAFVGTTLEDANLIAAVFCFLSLSAACQRDEDPPVANVGNTPVTCSITCDGGTFSVTIQSGAFRLENQSAANAAALSYCNAHIYPNSFCLGALAAGICVNEIYAAVVSTTGPGSPTTMGVTSGQLPPGLSLSGGLLSGIATTPGSYTFTISAASAFGFASRTYTVTIAEIATVVLLDGSTSAPYSQAIVTNGFTNPTFTIVGGALPTPWTLHPTTGVISGAAADTAGDYAFVVLVDDGVAQCTQDYTVTVTGVQVQAYWRLEGPPAANHDEITGNLLTYNNFGAVLTSPAAVVGNGLDIGGAAFCTFQQQGPTLAYAGPNGFSVALWIRWSSAGTGNEGFVYQWDNIGLPGALSWIIGTGEFHFLNLGGDTTGNTAIPAADVFHFAVFTYDPTDNNLRFSVDGGAFVILGNPGVVTPVADATSYLVFGNESCTYDEVQLYSIALNEAQKDYLWNSGSGRVYPPSLPP